MNIATVGLAGVCGMICAVIGAMILWNIADANRALIWRRRREAVGDWLQATFAGQLFDRTFGNRSAMRALEGHIVAERRERALALAQRYDLVEEGALMVEVHRGPMAAADFAGTAGDKELARRFFRNAVEAHARRGEHSLAAEAAQAAGHYDEAVRHWRKVPGGGAMHVAKLSEKCGHPREALEAYLEAGAGGDALRVAQARGLVEEMIRGVEERADPALWRVGAEAAVKMGDIPKAVNLFRRSGDLELARDTARRAGLEPVVRELQALLDARRTEERRDLLHGSGLRVGGGNMAELAEPAPDLDDPGAISFE